MRSLSLFVFIQQLLILSTYYVIRIVLGSGDIAVTKTDKISFLTELTSQGQPYTKQVSKIHSVLDSDKCCEKVVSKPRKGNRESGSAI